MADGQERGLATSGWRSLSKRFWLGFRQGAIWFFNVLDRGQRVGTPSAVALLSQRRGHLSQDRLSERRCDGTKETP